jgi:hypothetical protein
MSCAACLYACLSGRELRAGYIEADLGAKVAGRGHHGPFDPAQRVQSGKQPSGVRPRLSVAVFLPGQGFGGIEGVGGGDNGHPVGATEHGHQRVDAAPNL